MKLIELAKILRSKNAGPLFLTFDLMFHNTDDMKRAYHALEKTAIARAYGVDAKQVSIIPYDIVASVKITFPRKVISGSIYDTDVYGCQQHLPLANMELPVVQTKKEGESK